MAKSVSDYELNYLVNKLTEQINDKLPVSDVTNEATANKLLKLNADGKLPTDITGDADTVDGKHASDFIAASDVTNEATANKLLKLNADGKLPADITGSATKLSTAKTINLTGDISGSNKFDGGSNTDINVVIKSVSGPLTLNGDVFGDDLPTKNLTEGRIFFRRVESGAVASLNPIVLSENMYGNALPDDTSTENTVFFVETP